ncbi:hypothetical protein SOVF_154320 isoform B [Spinacia oleracea]|nr:hypothetical protein SOVF_154320 isoform B [Spinacia oleracea]
MSNSDTISIGIAANDDSYSVIPTIFSPECDNNNVNDDNIAGSSEALAEGISTMLAGVIRDFDSKAEDASRSQFQLISALDRLTSEVRDWVNLVCRVVVEGLVNAGEGWEAEWQRWLKQRQMVMGWWWFGKLVGMCLWARFPECLTDYVKWLHYLKFLHFKELDQLLEDAPLPFIMQHATKLSNVRKRVSSLNLLLRSVQHRLDNIDRMMSIGSLDNKSNVGGSK